MELGGGVTAAISVKHYIAKLWRLEYISYIKILK